MQCADITFTSASVSVKTCSNGTGVTAEPATDKVNPSASSSGSATKSGSAAATTSSSAADAVKVAGGALVAGVVGIAAWFL
jgi:hypothetical protein